MALSYQTNWDTCQYLDYPATPNFSLPDLMDMELQQTLSLDHYNFPSIDPIFDTSIEGYNNHYSYPYLFPYQTLHDSKPCLSDNFIDFSTTVENLPCLSDSHVDLSTDVEKLSCLSDRLIGFSTDIEELSCMSDGHIGLSPIVRKRPFVSDDHVGFSTNVRKLPCQSDGFVDFSINVEKLPCLSDGFVDFSLPGFQCPPVFNIGSGGGGSSGGMLSAQSVAARQRRRKITERTQELGKLVPGGNKMNTAEMFGAAYDYIKYLQAQVGILELLGSTQEKEQQQLVVHSEELQKLASSSKVQEKLYSHRKCLVPKHFVEGLANDHELQNSNPVIAKEIQQLIQKSG